MVSQFATPEGLRSAWSTDLESAKCLTVRPPFREKLRWEGGCNHCLEAEESLRVDQRPGRRAGPFQLVVGWEILEDLNKELEAYLE